MGVLFHGDVAHMVEGFDAPVAAGGGGDGLRGAAALRAAAGDAQGRDGRSQVAGGGIADGALDEERLGRVGEQAVRGGQDLRGAGLGPAVAGVAGGVRDGGGGPFQGVQRRGHAGLVVFHGGEQVAGFLVFHQVTGGVPLNVQGVRRDQRPGDIHLRKQRLDLGDLIGFLAGIPLGDHGLGAADHRR